MARTRYELRVAGLRGRALKKIYTKVTSKALLPRNAQHATRNESHHQHLKSGGGFGKMSGEKNLNPFVQISFNHKKLAMQRIKVALQGVKITLQPIKLALQRVKLM